MVGAFSEGAGQQDVDVALVARVASWASSATWTAGGEARCSTRTEPRGKRSGVSSVVRMTLDQSRGARIERRGGCGRTR